MTLFSPIQAPVGRLQIGTALFLAVAMAVVVGAALGFEHIGGYIPCALCLQERLPYYYGAPLMLIAAIVGRFGAPGIVVRGLLLVGGLLMTWGMVMGIYHAGVEWHFWPGPTTCATSAPGVTTNAGDLLGDINSKKPPACDTAALRVLGLSFAGWNVVASAILAAIAFRAAFKPAWRP